MDPCGKRWQLGISSLGGETISGLGEKTLDPASNWWALLGVVAPLCHCPSGHIGSSGVMGSLHVSVWPVCLRGSFFWTVVAIVLQPYPDFFFFPF